MSAFCFIRSNSSNVDNDDSGEANTETEVIHNFNSAYLRAAEKGNLGTLVSALNSGADIQCKDGHGNSALHIAARKGHDTIVKTLVDRGLDVNTQGDEGVTPLMTAAYRGHESTVNILISAGADITCKDKYPNNALHLAAIYGHDTIVKTLVDHGLDIDTRGHRDKTVLMLAAEQARGALVKMLVNKGARLDLKDQDGRSALQIILDKQMLGEREEIINSFMKHLEEDYDEAREQYKIVKKIKAMTPSSAGLRDCIASVSDRFKWGMGKFWFTLLINFILLTLSMTFYGLDLYTDIKFSHFLLNQTSQNFSSLIDECKPEFNVTINEIINSCQNEFNSSSPLECLNLLEKAKNLGDSCFNRGQRFDDNSEEWNKAGNIAAIHCALPFLVSLGIWMIQNKICSTAICSIPSPIISKLCNFFLTGRLGYIYTKNRNSKDDKSEYENKKNKWIEKIRRNEAIANLSHLIEATFEASFQFTYQTVYLMPTVFISLTAAESKGLTNWTDIFQWRILSILISFGSFAFTFYNIR